MTDIRAEGNQCTRGAPSASLCQVLELMILRICQVSDFVLGLNRFTRQLLFTTHHKTGHIAKHEWGRGISTRNDEGAQDYVHATLYLSNTGHAIAGLIEHFPLWYMELEKVLQYH